MSNAKNKTDIELLSMLDNAPLTSSKSVDPELTPLVRFLLEFKITAGKITVQRRLMYFLFKKWSGGNPPYDAFVKEIDMILPKMPGTAFGVNNTATILMNMVSKASKLKNEGIRFGSPRQRMQYVAFKNAYKLDDVSEGYIWVPSKDLWNLYNKWSKGRTRPVKQNRAHFTVISKDYFEYMQKQTGHFMIYYFKINAKLKNQCKNMEVEMSNEKRKENT